MTTLLGTTSGEGEPAVADGNEPQAYDLSQTPAWAKELDLEDSIKADPSLRPIADINNLAKSYVNAQKMIGADKIVVPGKHASEEDWQNVFRKLGNPDSLDEYDLGVDVEGDGFDAQFFNQFKEQAHKLGVLPHQAKELYQWHEQLMNSSIEQQEQQALAQQEEGIRELQQEWGEAFEGKIRLARAAIDQLGGDQLSEYLNETGLGNDPVMIQVFSKIGEMYKEDGIVGEGNMGVGQTKDEIQESVNNMLADPNHPYYQKSHPNHQAAVAEMAKLMAKLH